MTRPSFRLIATHLLSAGTGAAVWFLFLRPTIHAFSAASLPVPEHAQRAVRDEDPKPSPPELRAMLENLESVAMSPEERDSMREGLLKDWAELDSEGFLIWFDKQTAIPVSMRPSLQELARRNPDFFYRYATEHSDKDLFDLLAEANPSEALRLYLAEPNDLSAATLPDVFWGVMQENPELAGKLDDIADPDLRKQLSEVVARAIATSGNSGQLVAWWSQHPESLSAENVLDRIEQLEPIDRWHLLGSRERDAGADVIQISGRIDNLVELGTLMDRLGSAAGPSLWRDLLDRSGFKTNSDEEAATLKTLAANKGEGEGVEILARCWVRSGLTASDLTLIYEPGLRDLCVQEYFAAHSSAESPADGEPSPIGPDETQQLLDSVANPALKEGLRQKYRPKRP